MYNCTAEFHNMHKYISVM